MAGLRCQWWVSGVNGGWQVPAARAVPGLTQACQAFLGYRAAVKSNCQRTAITNTFPALRQGDVELGLLIATKREKFGAKSLNN